MKLKFKKLHPEAKLPSYGHSTDAGIDFYTIDEFIFNPGEQKLIPTGLSIDLPSGHVGLFWDKSSLASQKGLKSLGGVIDSSYTGEMKVILINLSKDIQIIPKGAKFIQLLIQKIEYCELELVDEIIDGNRGKNGFGSTGEF